MIDPFSDSRIDRIDRARVHQIYDRWPSLASEGFAAKVELPQGSVKKAFVLGMGGSASGGDIIAGWASDRAGIEVAVFKGKILVSDMSDSIAVACSASGETVETIDMLRTAVQRGARVLAISGGGTVKEEATRLGVPHIGMPKVDAPRYMLPFIVFSTLAVFNRGLGLGCEEEAEDAISAMGVERKKIVRSVPLAKNGSKRLALHLLRKTPSIYGARITQGVGIRFKNVLNENSKKHAHFDGIPDAFHNEIESWEDPTERFLPIFLRHPSEGDRDRTLADRMFSVLRGSGKRPVQVSGMGNTSLARLMTMAYRLDFTSYYAAIGLGRDPFPTRLIDALKKGA
jgi:glucose/mannose-6-phosphate isomerase